MSSEYPVPQCPDCKCEFCLVLSYSDIYGCCIQCQNCNADFPISDLKKLYRRHEDIRGAVETSDGGLA